MGFGGNLPPGLIDFVASQPNTGPRVIEPEPDDTSTTRPRRFNPAAILSQQAPAQLDASNLAGPVPTDLSGQPFDYTKALAPQSLDRSNLAGAVPTDLSGPPAASPASGPQISNVEAGPTMGLAGTPPVAAPRTGYANLPSQVQTPINQTWNGTPAPSITDPKYTEMGRGASAKAAFLEGLKHGGLIGGGLNALIGVLDKGYGRQAAYNQDTARWFNTKDAQLKAEEADPLLRSKIAEAQFEQEAPVRKDIYQANQNVATGNKIILEDKKHVNKMEEIDSRDADSYARAGLHEDAKTNRRYNEMFNLLRNSSVNAGKSDDDLRDLAATQIKKEDEVKQAKTEQQTALYKEQTAAVGRKLDQADTRIKQAQQRIGIQQQNANTASGRLGVAQGNQAQRTMNQAVQNQLSSLRSSLSGLRSQHAAYSKMLNDPYITDESVKTNAAAELKRIDKEIDAVDEQSRRIAGAPARGQQGAPSVGGTAGGGVHPQQGQAFKNPNDGKWYVADEIDKDGNITKYHPRP